MTDELSTPAPLPSKPYLASVTSWAQIATFVVGLAVMAGLPEGVASVLRTNAETIVGAVLAIIAAVGTYANARRTTTLRL